MNVINHLPDLPLGVYRFRFLPQGAYEQPLFAGSAWRGAFGHALRRTVCVTRGADCAQCMLFRSCAYPWIFETPPPENAEKMRRYRAAPHPFVFHLPWRPEPRTLEKGQESIVGLVLVGHANRQLPYVIHALQQAGREGLGRQRVPMRLEAVEQEQAPGGGQWSVIYREGGPMRALPAAPPVIPPCPERAVLHLETPLRLKRDRTLVTPEAFDAVAFLGPLVRRISMLSYFHTDTPLETDFKALAARSRQGRIIDADLRWQEWARYSSRQKAAMKMGGLMGTVDLEMTGLEAHWPYLWLGQWIHAGKGAGMGLGRYSIEPASLPERTGGEI